MTTYKSRSKIINYYLSPWQFDSYVQGVRVKPCNIIKCNNSNKSVTRMCTRAQLQQENRTLTYLYYVFYNVKCNSLCLQLSRRFSAYFLLLTNYFRPTLQTTSLNSTYFKNFFLFYHFNGDPSQFRFLRLLTLFDNSRQVERHFSTRQSNFVKPEFNSFLFMCCTSWRFLSSVVTWRLTSIQSFQIKYSI